MAVLSILVLAACFYDYRRARIPNWLLVLVLAAGLAKSFAEGGPVGAALCALKVPAVCSLFYPLFKIGALGAGDVKLFGVCAGWMPFEKIFPFLFLSLLVAAVFSLIKLLVQRNAVHTVIERLACFYEYLSEAVKSGKWHLYVENTGEKRREAVCLSGPVLCSILFYWGGLY